MVVRKIYHWYIHDRLTLRQIGEKLYEMGISPKRGESKNWGASSIGRILNSEIYIGKYYYNRRKFKKVKGMRTKAGNPKKTYDYRNEEEWLMVSIPPIVEPTVFELARKQREVNFTRSGNNKYEYLLNTKIKCAICGRKWSATTYSGRQGLKYTCYRCPNHAPKRYGPEVKRCPVKTIRGELLDNYVWSLVMEFLSTPEDYIEQLKETSEIVVGELIQAIAVVEKDMKDKTAELERVKTLFKHGVINEEEMLTEYHKLMAGMEGLNENLKKYKAQLQASKQEELTSETITELTEKVQEFIEQNGQQLNYKEKRFVIDSLIDEILIRYVDDDVTLIIIGHLGALQDSSVQKGVIIQRAFKLVSSGRRHEKKIIPIEQSDEKQ